jgi:hypothetical protein
LNDSKPPVSAIVEVKIDKLHEVCTSRRRKLQTSGTRRCTVTLKTKYADFQQIMRSQAHATENASSHRRIESQMREAVERSRRCESFHESVFLCKEEP